MPSNQTPHPTKRSSDCTQELGLLGTLQFPSSYTCPSGIPPSAGWAPSLRWTHQLAGCLNTGFRVILSQVHGALMGLSSQTFSRGELDFLCHNTAEPNAAAELSLSSSSCPCPQTMVSPPILTYRVGKLRQRGPTSDHIAGGAGSGENSSGWHSTHYLLAPDCPDKCFPGITRCNERTFL